MSGGIGSNFLQPGYRSDVLLVFPKAGTYCMLNQAITPAERVNGGWQRGYGERHGHVHYQLINHLIGIDAR